jgi:polyisoprenoid-binding protein YceI
MKLTLSLALLVPVVMLMGCGNPADNVPAASVSSETNTATSTATPAPTDGKTLVFGPDTSKIGFVGSKVTGSHNGGFQKFVGELRVVNGKIADQGNKVVIDTTSLFADNERLTGHLKSPDFFNVAQFPTATFETTSVQQQGTNHNVSGNLTLHGVTKQIAFPATINVSDSGANISATFFINRFDFEIKYAGKADDLIRKEVVLKLDVKATPGKADFQSIGKPVQAAAR